MSTAATLTPEQLGILQHALGTDQYGRPGRGERNHYCAGGDDVLDCAELVAIGYMRTFRRSWLPYFNCVVTEAGKAAMLRESPRPPKLTAGERRYREFLDADSGLSFREWLLSRSRRWLA